MKKIKLSIASYPDFCQFCGRKNVRILRDLSASEVFNEKSERQVPTYCLCRDCGRISIWEDYK